MAEPEHVPQCHSIRKFFDFCLFVCLFFCLLQGSKITKLNNKEKERLDEKNATEY